MLRIRLNRVGKKNSPAYRLVVADQQKAVKRKFIEIIGNYNPTQKPKTIVINKERALFWLSRGAQATPTVHNLMCDNGVLSKDHKINKVYGKAKPKKDKKEISSAKPELATAEKEDVKKSDNETQSEDKKDKTEEKDKDITSEIAQDEKPENDTDDKTKENQEQAS